MSSFIFFPIFTSVGNIKIVSHRRVLDTRVLFSYWLVLVWGPEVFFAGEVVVFFGWLVGWLVGFNFFTITMTSEIL